MNKKLYLVTCNGGSSYLDTGYDVYVVAENEHEASSKALEKMKELQYKYTEYISNVKLLADEYQYGGPKILVF